MDPVAIEWSPPTVQINPSFYSAAFFTTLCNSWSIGSKISTLLILPLFSCLTFFISILLIETFPWSTTSVLYFSKALNNPASLKASGPFSTPGFNYPSQTSAPMKCNFLLVFKCSIIYILFSYSGFLR